MPTAACASNPGISLAHRAAIAATMLAVLLAPAGQASGQALCGNGKIEPPETCDDSNGIGGDGCSAACQVEQQCYDEGDTFSFFVWSDSYTSSGDDGVKRVFNDAVDAVRHTGRVIPRFWISVGDIPFMADRETKLDELNDEISNGLLGARYPFTCTASNGQFPYFVAVGNHDVDGYGGAPEAQYDYWRNVVGPRVPSTLVGLTNFREGPNNGHDARTTYSFDYKNAHFVITNQYFNDPTYPTYDPVACIRPELYDWIDQDLASTDRPVKFVFGHESAWSHCSTEWGYGGPENCPVTHPDNVSPPYRPRPYSTAGPWPEPFGRHWSDSLEDWRCPEASREQFWSMLGRRNAVAHFVGHNHVYESRLVQGDGVRRNDVSKFAKTGQTFNSTDGTWEVNAGQVHNGGAIYLLATVRDKTVSFESFDYLGGVRVYIRLWTRFGGIWRYVDASVVP